MHQDQKLAGMGVFSIKASLRSRSRPKYKFYCHSQKDDNDAHLQEDLLRKVQRSG